MAVSSPNLYKLRRKGDIFSVTEWDGKIVIEGMYEWPATGNPVHFVITPNGLKFIRRGDYLVTHIATKTLYVVENTYFNILFEALPPIKRRCVLTFRGIRSEERFKNILSILSVAILAATSFFMYRQTNILVSQINLDSLSVTQPTFAVFLTDSDKSFSVNTFSVSVFSPKKNSYTPAFPNISSREMSILRFSNIGKIPSVQSSFRILVNDPFYIVGFAVASKAPKTEILYWKSLKEGIDYVISEENLGKMINITYNDTIGINQSIDIYVSFYRSTSSYKKKPIVLKNAFEVFGFFTSPWKITTTIAEEFPLSYKNKILEE